MTLALSLCSAECQFVSMLMNEMTDQQILPYVVNMDNSGAIFMANNPQVGARTKHIDIKYHYSKELIEAGRMKVKYVNSKDNYADIMTKNVSEGTFRFVPDLRQGTLNLSMVEND